MSYDVDFLVPNTEQHANEDGTVPAYWSVCLFSSVTWNLTPIFNAAFGHGLKGFKGLTGAQALPILERGLAVLIDPDRRKELLALEPSNKWGTLAGAVRITREFIDACCEHLEHAIDVC